MSAGQRVYTAPMNSWRLPRGTQSRKPHESRGIFEDKGRTADGPPFVTHRPCSVEFWDRASTGCRPPFQSFLLLFGLLLIDCFATASPAPFERLFGSCDRVDYFRRFISTGLSAEPT
jgi:hypothetical protein